MAFISILISVSTVWMLSFLLHSEPLFSIKADHWNFSVFPYFILLGIVAGLNSVYLTKSVLFFKSKFAKISKSYVKIILGSLIISISFLFFPQLYGDGYHSMRALFQDKSDLKLPNAFMFVVLGILILKPIITSVTLATGGDGGVFGPSLFIGAFLGLFISFILNNFFRIGVIPINFMVIGMAAVLKRQSACTFYSCIFSVQLNR